MNSSFFGYDLASQYIHQLQYIGTGRMAGILTAATLIALLVIAMAVLSQGALILGAKNQDIPSPHSIRKEAHKHFWDLLTIATLTKVANALLVVLMTLPLLLFYVQTTLYSASLFFLGMILFIPAVLIVNIISMLALIDVVAKNRGAIHAIEHALCIFKKHWVSTIEFGLLLFMIIFGVGFVLVAAISLLSIPYAIAYTTTLLSGSYALFIMTNILSFVVVTALILTMGGAMVSFQYIAWYQFYMRAIHKTHGRHPFACMLKLLGR